MKREKSIILSFQFQYGSIGGQMKTVKSRPLNPCFNSNMVRLGAQLHGVSVLAKWFQFQYGSIGGLKIRSKCFAFL